MNFINLNGKILPGGKPALLVSNRSYRYGDGLFETMKVIGKKIVLESFHFERLFNGLSLLGFEIPDFLTTEKIVNESLHLCKTNSCELLARIRLSVFRGNGGLYDVDEQLQYIIECWPVNATTNTFNEIGLVIDVYPDAKKTCDIFSNLKSASFMPYNMAVLYGKKNKLDDCLILNTAGKIADSTIANAFIIKDNVITTPALNEGAVNGVMRRFLLEQLKHEAYNIQEGSISVSNLEMADEFFLTNAITGIRWVRQFRSKMYSNFLTTAIYNRFIKTIFG